MKTLRYSSKLVPAFLALLLLAAFPRLASAQVATNWIAFNDHRTTTNTHPNATGWEMGQFGDTNGPLRDFVTGAELEAMFFTTFTATPDNFGANQDPNAGTPAYNLFNGIVDVGSSPGTSDGDGIVGVRADQGSTVTLVFTNLNPTQRYLFRGTSVRGNNYVNRWAYFTILGADSFVDAHVIDPGTNNLLTPANFPAATLTAGQVALNSGENRAGSLVGWNEINPGADGSFSILEQQYVGPTPYGDTTVTATAPYGYGLCAMMLLEVGSPLPVTIQTQPPASLTVLEQRPINLTISVQGAPLPTYQWHKVGVGPIPGATRRTYTITNAVLGDSGDYFVVVSNPQNTVTSSTSSVTVLPDTFPPVVVSVTAATTETTMVVQYDEALDTGTAEDPFNYAINGGNVAMAVQTAPNIVTLTLSSPLVPCAENQLIISSIMDLFNQTLTSTTVVFTASLRLTAPGDAQPWRYDQTGTDRGTAWIAPGYDDSAWTAGPQLFDVSTTPRTALPNGVLVSTMLQLTSPTSVFTTNNLPTSYLRTHFNLPTGPGNITRLRGRLLLDDGAIIYLNGVEAYRQGVLAGTAFAAYCNGSIGTADYQAVELLRSALREGDNVLAVELKNSTATSTDLTFGLELTADLISCAPSAPSLSIAQSGGQITITWSAANGTLQRATALPAVPAGWTDVTGATSPYTFTATGGAAFFRLATP